MFVCQSLDVIIMLKISLYFFLLVINAFILVILSKCLLVYVPYYITHDSDHAQLKKNVVIDMNICYDIVLLNIKV